MSVNLSQMEIKTFTDEIAAATQPLALKNANTLQVEYAENMGAMFTDVTKLRQCVQNLLDNACKFTKEGEILLRVETEKLNQSDWLHFTVSDTGIGISDQQSHQLFAEFTQADSSTTKNYQGAGLGLALSQRFCELLGGHIACSSKLGEGSVFTISIPKVAKTSTRDIEYQSQSGEINNYSKSA